MHPDFHMIGFLSLLSCLSTQHNSTMLTQMKKKCEFIFSENMKLVEEFREVQREAWCVQACNWIPDSPQAELPATK